MLKQNVSRGGKRQYNQQQLLEEQYVCHALLPEAHGNTELKTQAGRYSECKPDGELEEERVISFLDLGVIPSRRNNLIPRKPNDMSLIWVQLLLELYNAPTSVLYVSSAIKKKRAEHFPINFHKDFFFYLAPYGICPQDIISNYTIWWNGFEGAFPVCCI